MLIASLILFIISFIPSAIALTKNTKHDERSCAYDAATFRGTAIAFLLAGIGLLLMPYMLEAIIALAKIVIQLIVAVLALPFKLLS